MRYRLLAALVASALSAPLCAQEQKVDDLAKPADVTVAKLASGQAYADAHGSTLYVLDARLARARTGTIERYCLGPCQQSWAPLKAAADAAPAGFWKVVDGVEGPQWSYRGSPVFTYKADPGPGATAGDRFDDVFLVLAYVPPPPDVVAPASVSPKYVAGDYVLADGAGHPLFSGTPAPDWVPLTAGLAAARKLGEWTVTGAPDQPQWAYRGNAVFVSQSTDPAQLPPGAILLRP